MKNVFVNGTAAKTGGSVTILDSYLASKVNDIDNYFYIFCPNKPPVLPVNSRWIKCSTGGASTLLFSILLCFPLALYYRCSKIVSFSNINTVISVPWIHKVTYFHNMLILNQNTLKYRLLRWLTKHAFQRKVQYIFQTSYVKAEFEKAIGFMPKHEIMWPGINYQDINSSMSKISSGSYPIFRFLVPIMDISYPHKNYQLINSFVSDNCFSEFQYYITADNNKTLGEVDEGLFFLGKLSHDDFLKTINEYDGLLIVSETETLCLPIFEALVRNKPVFVLDKDYLKGLESEFGIINGLYKFYDFVSLVTSVEKSLLEPKSFFRKEYLKGNWDF